MTDEHTKPAPRWVTIVDRLAWSLALLAGLVFVTGGARWQVAGIIFSFTSPGRLAAAAGLVAIVRRLAWRERKAVADRPASRAATMRAWLRGAATERWTLPILAGAFLFLLVNNAIWLIRDAASPSWDKAAHARFALQFLRAFQDPLHVTLGGLLGITKYYPPLFHICSVPFTMVLGFSAQHVAATNFLFLVVAVCSIYGIGRRLFGEGVGVGAAVLTLLYPMVFVLSREVLIDFPLTAMVALALYVVLSSDAGLSTRRSMLLGLVLGCAMLTKWTAVVFVAPPALAWFVVSLRRTRPSLRSAAESIGMMAVVAALVAIPWYLTALGPFLKGAGEAFGAYPVQEGDPSEVIPSLMWYWAAVKDVLIMKPLLLPTALGLVAFAARVRNRAAWAFLLCWFVPAAAFFILIPNKDARYVTPLLPAVALTAAAGIQALPWKAVRALVWAFSLVVGVWQFYGISFGWPATIPHAYSHTPERRDWKIRNILDAIVAIPSPQRLKVAVFPDEPDFEPNLFQLDAAVRSLPVEIIGFDGGDAPVRALLAYDVLVSKTGTIAPPWTATPRVKFAAALDAWTKGGNRDPELALWRTWPLPDGSVAEVYLIRGTRIAGGR